MEQQPNAQSQSKPRAGVDPLLDATLEIVAERGVGAVTVRAVAERAGVSPGTVSYHFASADDLLVRALERGAIETAEMLERLTLDLQNTDWDSETLVRAFATAFAQHIKEHRSRLLASFELQLMAARRPEFAESAANVQLAYTRVARFAAQAYGIPDADSFAVRMTAMVTGLTFANLVTGEPGDGECFSAFLLESIDEAARPVK